MPRASRPALPASERKHGVCAVSLIGSASAASTCSRTVLVSEISEVEIRYCSGDTSSPPRGDPEHVVLELRQLAGAFEDLAVDDVGRPALGVAVLAGLHVEHELGERAVQPRDRAAQEREARARELGAGVEVHAERRAEVDVVPRRELEAARRAPAAHLDVGALVRADRHARVGQVGQRHQHRRQLGLDRLQPRRRALELAGDAVHLGHLGAGVGALPLLLADLLRQAVAPRLQLLGARLQALALGLEGDEALDVEKGLRRLARLETGDDGREVLAQERDIEHGGHAAGLRRAKGKGSGL